MIVNDGILWLVSAESIALNDTAAFVPRFVHFLVVGVSFGRQEETWPTEDESSIVSSLICKLFEEATEVTAESLHEIHRDGKMIENSTTSCC